LNKVRTTAFLKKSKFGRLPTLIEHHPSEEIAISESQAILIFLSERFSKSSLGFDNFQSKIQCLSWLNYIYSGFAEQVWNILSELYLLDKSDIREERLQYFFLELKYQMTILNKHLAKRAYLSGDYSMADTIATPFLDLIERIPHLNLLEFSNIISWRERIRNRPSYRGAWPS
jgi:glutathione S-transferase